MYMIYRVFRQVWMSVVGTYSTINLETTFLRRESIKEPNYSSTDLSFDKKNKSQINMSFFYKLFQIAILKVRDK